MNIRTKGLGMKSIRWKIVLIYVLLVLIATTIIGVFIINQLENYYINSVRSNMKNTVQEGTLVTSLNSYENLADYAEECQSNIEAWGKTLGEEVFVVDDNLKIIASNNTNQGQSATRLDTGIIITALEGKYAESFGIIETHKNNISIMNMVFPIGEGAETTGVLYLRVDMSSIEENMGQAQSVFIKGMAIALIITVLLGFLIARSITEPINDVTAKAEKMAGGDFQQEVSVKSGDEIGQLAQMFNILRIQLNDTLSQISNEKNKLEAVLRYMADALIAVDLSGHIIHANHAACEMLHVTAEAAETQIYDNLIQNFNKELKLDMLRARCETGAVSEIFENGGLTYAIRFDNYKDEFGSNIGIIMIIQDITERQKLENMQRDFIANISHELKTPLTTIKSYAETLMEGSVDDKETTIAFLEIINTEADRMNRLVKDLLQMSRLDYKQENWYKKDSNIISLLKTAVTKVELTAVNKNQHLNCLFDPDLKLPVFIGKDGIEQVILNVLSNASKYTQDGGRIDIDAFKKEKNALIVISDNGMGIPENQLPRVFERFFRVDKARSRDLGGTGLGLAISKQIIEEHDGSIEIESKEGKGTKVFITLPLSVRRGTSNIE